MERSRPSEPHRERRSYSIRQSEENQERPQSAEDRGEDKEEENRACNDAEPQHDYLPRFHNLTKLLTAREISYGST